MKSKRNSRRRSITPLPPPPPSTSSTESSYAFTLTRVAVAQICNSIGFTAVETSALRVLSDIATRYLRSIAKSAADSANSACRTQSNLIDTVAAVEELSSVTGFAGAWRASTGGCYLNSGAVKELARFSDYSEEIPFAKSLPRKIFLRNRGKGLRDNNNNEYIGGERKHIPKWLPVMPVIEKEEVKKSKEIWGFCGEIEVTPTTIIYPMKSNKIEYGEVRMYADDINKTEENVREREGVELPLKRGKVKFKIGIGGGGGGVLGVCRRRGGTGKRVLCDNWIFDDNNQKKRLKR